MGGIPRPRQTGENDSIDDADEDADEGVDGARMDLSRAREDDATTVGARHVVVARSRVGQCRGWAGLGWRTRAERTSVFKRELG